jgi:hypothetical protein
MVKAPEHHLAAPLPILTCHYLQRQHMRQTAVTKLNQEAYSFVPDHPFIVTQTHTAVTKLNQEAYSFVPDHQFLVTQTHTAVTKLNQEAYSFVPDHPFIVTQTHTAVTLTLPAYQVTSRST